MLGCATLLDSSHNPLMTTPLFFFGYKLSSPVLPHHIYNTPLHMSSVAHLVTTLDLLYHLCSWKSAEQDDRGSRF